MNLQKPALRRLSRLLALCLALGAPALAAEPLSDFNTWGSAMVTGSLAGPWRYSMEGHGRFGDDSSRLSQGLLRPALWYALDAQSSLWFGYAWITSDAPFAARPLDEHRLWQQYQYVGQFSPGTVTLRSRLEQRHLETGGDLGWRLRQLFRLVHPLPAAPQTSLVLWNEAFIHLNDTNWGVETGFDQNRAFVGVGQQFDAQRRVELGYLNHYVHRSRAVDRMNHVLWVSVAFNF